MTAPGATNGFHPSPDADALRFGVKVERLEYPPGVAGVKVSLTGIAKRVREGGRSPSMQQFANGVVELAGVARKDRPSPRRVAQILLDYVRANVKYVADPPGVEFTKGAHITLCVPGAAMCIPIGDCFPEGTLLLRDDFEFVPIEEIKTGQRIWGRDRWTMVEGKAFKGTLPVDAIEMNNGSTMCLTPDHKVYVGRCKHGKGVECPTCGHRPSLCQENFDRIRVSDLQEGETLLQPERIDFGQEDGDPDRLYVEALCLADGWVRDNCKCFYVAGRDGMRKEAQKHEVKEICEKLGIRTLWHRRYIVVYDEAWATRIAQLGSRARFKHLETINLTKESAESALRGLMADSSPSSSKKPADARTYSTTSRKLMLQVRVMHRVFGMSMSMKMLTPEQHGGAGKHPLWRLGQRKPSEGRNEKVLAVRSVERSVRKVPCWDIQTSDHYVYLPEHDVTVSNCDDLVTALGSLLMAYGIPVRILKQTFGAEDQEHVLIEFQDEHGGWIAADPSMPDRPVGWKASASDEISIDPLDLSALGMVGQAHEVEFIGVGGLPRVLLATSDGRWREHHEGKWWTHSAGVGWVPLFDIDKAERQQRERRPDLYGVGAAPSFTLPGYQIVSDGRVHVGLRYRIQLLFVSADMVSGGVDVQRQYLTDQLSNLFLVESLGPDGAVTGLDQSWTLQGVAKTDDLLSTLSSNEALFTPTVVNATVQASGTALAVPTASQQQAIQNQAQSQLAPPGPSIGLGTVLGIGLGVAVVGGLGWAAYKHRETVARHVRRRPALTAAERKRKRAA